MEKNEGFSLVEILVSMVILAIVMLVLTNITIVSTMGHASAHEKDFASNFAREKLQILQDLSTPATAGSIEMVYKGTTYLKEWQIEKGDPAIATITVSWNKDGRDHRTELAGFIDADNICTATGTARPTVVTFDEFGVQLPAGDLYIVPSNTSAGSLIGTVKGTDDDAGDIVTIELLPGEHNGMFSYSILDNNLKTSQMMNRDGIYPLKFKVKDCAGHTSVKTVKVQVVQTAKPLIDNQSFSDVKENYKNRYINTIVVRPEDRDNGANITYTSSDPRISIQSNGNVNKVGGHFDYETEHPIKVQVSATRESESTEFTLTLNLKDVNESPKGLVSYNATVSKNVRSGDSVITLQGIDPDVASTNVSWRTFFYYDYIPHTKFLLDQTTGVITVSAAGEGNLVPGEKEYYQVSLYDQGGKGYPGIRTQPLTVTITVTDDTGTENSSVVDTETGSGNPDDSCASAYAVYNPSSPVIVTYYGDAHLSKPVSYVTHAGKLWRGHELFPEWRNYDAIPGSDNGARWIEVKSCP